MPFCILTGMPSFYYDLVIVRHYRDQGCMELEDRAAAVERANRFAQELVLRPDLTGHGAAVRVVDEDNVEIYRTPLDPLPTWSRSQREA